MSTSNQERTGQRIKSLERGFDIVECLHEEGALTVSELAEERDIPTSTAHIYLKTLADLGYVVGESGRYELSFRFLEHGGHVRQRSELYHLARSEVDTLAEVTNEVSALGVPENGKRVLLYKTEGAEAVYDNPPIGEYTHMHWTALGKAILSEFPREAVTEIVDRHGLPSRTHRTIDTEAALFDELETTRERGYALEDEERWDGIRSVAVPILDEESVIGAISVSGPKHRFEHEWVESELLEHLTRSKNVISVRLRHQ
ncbi:IclR family transcriptional regulator [Natronobiforma cellulositropha]|uniref:IclR family transcriptional regulator n=1 Tax=Natronobiforma cellulositropha TaxID=1679076 RepID=UPI0021D5A3FF|nr:IclR family transcriptional regulator [Natronobiforma cellulositropha]